MKTPLAPWRVIRLLVVFCAGLPPLAHAADNECRPTAQQVCEAGACVRTSGEFQHAEVFFFEAPSRKLTACLWSACYSGKATVFQTPGSASRTVVGLLRPEDPSSTAEPMTVSLTLDGRRNFMAAWGFSGQGVTLDFGRCGTAD